MNNHLYPQTFDRTRTEWHLKPITAPKKNSVGSANMNSSAINKVWWYRQFSVPKPLLLVAAKLQTV